MADRPERPLVRAMAGMTISCSQPDQLIELISRDMGWQLICEGRIDASLEKLWGIAAGSAGERFSVYGSPGSSRGMIRVVGGTDRVRTRPMGTRWTGVEIVVMEDLDGLHQSLEARDDFTTIKAPAEADFTDAGANIHRFFHGHAPGGTHLMFTMAVTAPEADYDFPAAPSRVGYIFDIPLVSSDYPRSFEFLRDVLGMEPLLEDAFDEGIWHEAWHLPAGAHVDLAILKGDAENFGLGGIELQGYDPIHIDPIPVVNHHFDGGACLATYTAKDVAAVHSAVAACSDVVVLSEPASCAAYGGSQAFCFLGPSGERYEICEQLWT